MTELTDLTERTEHQTVPASAMRDVIGIVQVAIPVSDLAVSAAWYRDLLDLDYVREFGNDDLVTGCALADFTSHFMIALRLRSETPGEADLRGEHPIIVEAADADAAARVLRRADRLGIPYTAGQHLDAHWAEFIDPDGIALRMVHNADGPHDFLGVWSRADGTSSTYGTPRLLLP